MRGGGRHYFDEMEAPETTAIGVMLKQKIVLLVLVSRSSMLESIAFNLLREAAPLN